MTSPHSRHGILALFVLLLVSCSTPQAEGTVELEGSEPGHWRLIWHNDPATTATLSWNTVDAGNVQQVHLHAEGSEETTIVPATRNGRYSGDEPELHYHHARLSGLQPATKYHVQIESDGQRSREMFFVTAPAVDVPVSILFGADSRSDHDSRRQMNAMMGRMMAESHQGDRTPILALAHGGDFIQSGARLDQWAQWMSDHELTVGSDGRLLPIIPTRGNHDHGDIFNEVLDFPAEDENYYGIDLSPQVRLVTLNTECSVGGEQAKWLDVELAASRPKYRWLLAQYHRPAFPAVKNPWTNLTFWVPLFEEHNVDLVCEGDGHVIKRTPPIREQQIDPTGVVYIGEGGLGVEQRTPKDGRWYLDPAQSKYGKGHHVQLLTFDKEKLSYRVVMIDGSVFDEHHLSPRQRDPLATAQKTD